jgi:hypothetical protein
MNTFKNFLPRTKIKGRIKIKRKINLRGIASF